MKNLKLPIGILIDAMAEFKHLNLKNNVEINVSDLGVSVKTPTSHQLINHVIKKNNLPGRKFIFEDGTHLQCADGHLLYLNNVEITSDKFKNGDVIDSINTIKKISSIIPINNDDYYDISIDSPHKYIDFNGIIHHNTLITAALSYSVEKYGRTLVIVPNKSLVTQTEADYKNLNLDVGVYFGDRKEIGKTHTICTWQSVLALIKNTEDGNATYTIHEFLEDVACVICDEVHGAKADQLKSMLSGIMAHIPIRWGLTGTIPKEDFAALALTVCIGPVINKLTAVELQDKGVLSNCHVNILQLQDHREFSNYQQELKYLLEDSDRIKYISALISKISAAGNTLVLVDRISAGESLIELVPNSVFVSGSTKNKDRQAEYESISEADNKVIVATYQVAAVGINIPRIFNVILVEPGKSFVRTIQSIGRGLRKAKDKDHVEIWDVTSSCKFSKRHLTKRKEFYKEVEYNYSMEKVNWK